MNKDIIFKLNARMQHGILNMPLQTLMDCSIDDVLRSQNKSKLWNAIALSKFELQNLLKAQNVGNWTGYQKLKFHFHIQISKFWQVRNLRLPFHCFLLGMKLLLLLMMKSHCISYVHKVKCLRLNLICVDFFWFDLKHFNHRWIYHVRKPELHDYIVCYIKPQSVGY